MAADHDVIVQLRMSPNALVVLTSVLLEAGDEIRAGWPWGLRRSDELGARPAAIACRHHNALGGALRRIGSRRNWRCFCL